MAETLLEDVSPNGNIHAVVESDDDCCWFYLVFYRETRPEMKAVWVRNHTPAPETVEVERMRRGTASRNLARYCRHPAGRAAPAAADLRVVWLPEGNGAALYERDEILAIIPPWSGTRGCHGYALDNIGDGPLAWELNTSNVLVERFKQAQSYWQKWHDREFWPAIQSSQLSELEKLFGHHDKYYAIDGEKWPPKALVRFTQQDRTFLVTVGVALRPQPNVEMVTAAPEQLRRIELGAMLPHKWSEQAVRGFAGYIGAQSDLPWHRYTWLGSGHTLPCDSWQNPEYTAALLQHEHSSAPRIALHPFLGDPVNVLWFVPISEEERKVAVARGSKHLASRLPPDRWKLA